MGFRQRERRRKRKMAAAAVRDQRTARETGSSAGDWFLTIVQRKTCCARVSCRRILKVSEEMVFRKSPETHLCVDCATAEGVSYRASLRWERSHSKPKVRRGRAWMREAS